MTVPAIDVRALSKLHGNSPALLDVSFEVAVGSRVRLTGAPGSGKSTLLKLLAGCMTPSGGRIRLHGADLRLARLEATAAIGYVPQVSSACTSMRPADILDYSGRSRQLPRATLEQRIRSVVEQWDLGRCLDSRCDSLEPALRTRVALALAMLHEPALLLLDEPLTGLPAPDAHELLARIDARAGRATVVLACGGDTPLTAWGTRHLALARGRLQTDAR